ncbi:MAG: GAF domain-containing protein [Planctomycetota bacterium]|nr:MAG: GAF domain-containing protein [Planctomycetota bacterium]
MQRGSAPRWGQTRKACCIDHAGRLDRCAGGGPSTRAAPQFADCAEVAAVTSNSIYYSGAEEPRLRRGVGFGHVARPTEPSPFAYPRRISDNNAFRAGSGRRAHEAAPHGGEVAMLRELLDLEVLADFLEGVAEPTGEWFALYGEDGERVVARESPAGAFEASGMLARLPAGQHGELSAAADGEPGIVDFGGVFSLVAPIRLQRGVVGFLAGGLMRDDESDPPPPPGVDAGSWRDALDRLAILERDPSGPLHRRIRWAARMLRQWALNEARLDTASQELALLGDIGELLAGRSDLQTLLDRIVLETSRVMRCQYSSLRLYNPETDELRIAAAYNLSQRYRDIGVILRSENPIDDAALKGELVYIEDAQTDPRIIFQDEARRLGIHSGLTAGLIHRNRPLGVLRVYSASKREFRGFHRHLLRAVASQAAIAIDNAKLLDELIRSQKSERQLALAGDVQARMMRVRPPDHPRIEAAMYYEPSSQLGGDFCDLFLTSRGDLVAAVGDVVGHGAAAALLMASVRGALRASADPARDLADLMQRVNAHVVRETAASEFVTLILVLIDAEGRRLRYCNAGHEPLLLLRGDEVLRTEEAGLVLGVDADERYEEHAFHLRSGDFVFLLTDGLVEAMNFSGELFGRRRLIKLIKRYGKFSPERALRHIAWDIRCFAGLAEQSDDQTAIALRVK